MKRPHFLPNDNDDSLSCWILLFSGFGCVVLVGFIAWVIDAIARAIA